VTVLPLLALSLAAAAPPARHALAQGGAAARTSIEAIEVTGKAPDGSAEAGYVVRETPNLGPWGDRPLLDTPYTVNTAPEEYITNLQVGSPGDLFSRIPGVNLNGGGSEHNMQHTVNVRGFATAGSTSVRFNGVPTGNNSVAVFLEDMASVEVISGLSGFLYGMGNPGGTVNYNLKRPVYERLNRLRIGSYGRETRYAHLDLGGPLLGGRLAYRANLLVQRGEAQLDGQEKNRDLVSLALDWNPTDRLLVRANASRGRIDLAGRQGGFYVEADDYYAFKDSSVPDGLFSGNENAAYMTSLPALWAPPDNDKLWASLDTFNRYTTDNLGLAVDYRPGGRVRLRAAYAYNDFERHMVWGNNFFTLDPDVFRADIRGSYMYYKTKGTYGYLDLDFDTGPLSHTLTVGASGYFLETWTSSSTLSPGSGLLSYYTGRFSDPSVANRFDLRQFDMMGRAGTARKHKNADTLNANVVIGDSVRYGNRWELMLGVSHSTIRTRNFNVNTGARTSQYRKPAYSPTAALLFRPIPGVTAYASYMEALEAGVTVPDNASNWANKNETLPPLISKQYELGAKAELGGMFLAVALYEIRKALQYGDPARGTYVQDGLQRHRGIELTARGKLTEGLTLMGGMNFIDARVMRSGTRSHIGKRLSYSPRFSAKLYAEYGLPFLEGLTVTGGFSHFGKVYTTNANTLEVPAFSTADLGFRYAAPTDPRLTFRLNVTNVANRRYWYGGGNSHLQVGLPRTVAFSAELQF
jgi:iron complex outermembrane receptor protein